MLRRVTGLTILTLVVIYSSAFNSSAQEPIAFKFVSKASDKCISLFAADEPDGGGLRMRDCKNFPDFFISKSSNPTALTFQLTSIRFICLFTAEGLKIDQLPVDVRTRSCGGPDSLWQVPIGAIGQVRKVNQLQLEVTNFCLQENVNTSKVELEVCQAIPAQEWKFERVFPQP
jgi:hypothetical protein